MDPCTLVRLEKMLLKWKPLEFLAVEARCNVCKCYLNAIASVNGEFSPHIEHYALSYLYMYGWPFSALYTFCNVIQTPMPKKKCALTLELFKLCYLNLIWPLDLVRLTHMNKWSDLLSKTHSFNSSERPVRGGSTHTETLLMCPIENTTWLD